VLQIENKTCLVDEGFKEKVRSGLEPVLFITNNTLIKIIAIEWVITLPVTTRAADFAEIHCDIRQKNGN